MNRYSNHTGTTLVALALLCILAAAPGRVAAQTGTTPQTITFTSTPPIKSAVGDQYLVTATGGGSGNPVTFSIDAASSTVGACTIAGPNVSFTGVGNCIVDANQAGDVNYLPAPQVQQTITVGAINQPPEVCIVTSQGVCDQPAAYGTRQVTTLPFLIVAKQGGGSIGVRAKDPDSGTNNVIADITMSLPTSCCALAFVNNLGVSVVSLPNGGFQIQAPVGDMDTVLQTMSLSIQSSVPRTGRIDVALHDQGYSGACSATVPTPCDKVANATMYIHAGTSQHPYTEDEHTIGGTVIGLTGSGLTLQLNGESGLVAESVPVAANGTFTFSSLLDNGADYAVTVATQPAAPSPICTVSNGSGSVSGSNVSNVLVACGYNVTATASSHGTITPALQNVASGSAASFAMVPNTGFEVASVTGDTCTLTQQGTSNTWTSNAITQSCTVTAVFADYASQCTGAANYGPAFFDDFSGSVLDPTKWKTYAHGGNLDVANNSVAASAGTGFPYVTSVGLPILPAADFSVRWIATYGAQNNYGTGSLALTSVLPVDGASTWSNVADAWQDGTNYRVEVSNDATSGVMHAYSQQPPVQMQHDVEYCWLAGTTEVWVDGVRQMQAARNANVPRPVALWFGNPGGNSSGQWQPFTLNYVEVRVLNDVIFKGGFGTP